MNIENLQNRVKWAILAVFQNPQKKLVPSKYFLYEGINTIGSDDSKSEVALDVDGISPLHAEVFISAEGDAFIQDLSSAQGIFKKASLNPNKKVRLERNCRYSIIPDHEFYIGKYKCFIVAFDDDYKRGEERRQREREEIQSQSQKRNVNMTIELDETDLDDADNQDLFKIPSGSKEANAAAGKKILAERCAYKFYLYNQKKKVAEEYEKTLVLSDRDENDEEEEKQLFKVASSKRGQQKQQQQSEEYEKTLEIKSDGGDDQEADDLFGQKDKKQNQQQNSEYDKTLELSSDEDKEENERNLFNTKQSKGKSNQNNEYDKTLELSDRNSDEENQNLFENKKSKNKNREMECEKTLELSDVSDNDQDELFNVQKKNSNSKKQNNNHDQFEKTLELSDRNSDEENDNLFSSSKDTNNKSKQNQQNQKHQAASAYEKTLELSDKDSSENEKDELFNTKSQNQKNKIAMEVEKTLELSDKEDDKHDSRLFNTSQSSSLPISASQNAVSNRQKRMDILKNNYLFKKFQNSPSQPSQPSQTSQLSNNNKMVDENENQSNKKQAQLSQNKKIEDSSRKMIPEDPATPNLSEEEQSKQKAVQRRNTDMKKIVSPQPQSKGIQHELLQETLVDEDSFNDDGWFDNNTNEKNKNNAHKQNHSASLQATLLDSPQSQSQSQQNKNNKRASPLSPTLVDDDVNSVKSLNQSINSQKLKKHKSPISLSPTFLDEEVNLNLLSVQNQQARKLSQHSNQSRANSNQELAATLIDPSDSKSRGLSPAIRTPDSRENSGTLQNTIIDSPQSQTSLSNLKTGEPNQNTELMNRIKQQEDELRQLREQLSNQNKQQQQPALKVSIKEPEKQQALNPSSKKQSEQKSKQEEQEDEQSKYVINVLPSSSEAQTKELKSKQAKNINLDKVNKFDDLFGGDEEEEEQEKKNSSKQLYKRGDNSKSGNENSRNEDSNSGTDMKKQQGDNKLDASQSNSTTQQRNFGMLFNKKFPMRTLTMSDMKKSISPISSTVPASIDESDERSAGKVSNTLPQKTLFQTSDHNSSDDQSSAANNNKRDSEKGLNRNKSNDMKDEKVPSLGEVSEDLGEDPKKKQKASSSWVQLLKQKTGKIQDENSRNSTKSEDSMNNSQSKQRQTRQSQDKQMVNEDENGNILKDSLKIAVSGFKLKPDQKKGIKSIKSTFIEDNEEFDVLVVSEMKRTIKLLLALMKKKPIVNEQWLNDCIKQNKLIQNFSQYIPTGDNFKERFTHELSYFVEQRKNIGGENNIFEGNTFYVSKSLSEPSDEELASLIEAGGGQIRKTLPNKQMKKDTVMMVILGQSDLYTYKTVQKLKSVTCITCEAILIGALNSQFEPDKHIINANEFFKN